MDSSPDALANTPRKPISGPRESMEMDSISSTIEEGRAVQESLRRTKEGGPSPGDLGYPTVGRGLRLQTREVPSNLPPETPGQVLLVRTIKKILERVTGLEKEVEAHKQANTTLQVEVKALKKVTTTTTTKSYAQAASVAPEQRPSQPLNLKKSKKVVEKTTTQATTQSTTKSTAKPTAKSTAKSTVKFTTQSTTQSTAKSTTQEQWTTVSKKAKKQPKTTTQSKAIPKAQYSQVVISIEKNATFEIQPLTIRNAINLAISTGVVKVEKTARNNIVLMVLPTVITSEDLLARKDEWEHVFFEYQVVGIQEPTKWYKLVAQGVPVRVQYLRF
ncbi:hypothetical protein GE09DRAFT_1142234 [Coniochaeta sp. 2T2.1]|nr:hypothetical protein GE09DRAFT_1142234 [Coniochaeta sp. 2T2.1]